MKRRPRSRHRSGACCGPRVLSNAGPGPKFARLSLRLARQRVQKAVQDVYHYLCRIGTPVGRRANLRFDCSLVRKDRERGNHRAFFHVGHQGGWTLCAASEAGLLPDCHLYALALHEFGHPIAYKLVGKSRQEDADLSMHRLTGIPILYRTAWTVQWITPADVRRIRTLARR